MVSLTVRAMLALQHLLSAPGPVTVGALARRLRVSPRAVRYDLQAADAWLRARGLPRLRHQPGVGVSFAGSDRDRHEALQALSAMTPDVYVATPRERLQLLLILLFVGEGKLTHQAVREVLQGAAPTVIPIFNFTDTKEIRAKLEEYLAGRNPS